MDTLVFGCYGENKNRIDPRDRNKAIAILTTLKKHGHTLDPSEIRNYLKTSNNVKSSFIEDVLKYVDQVNKGRRKKVPNAISPDSYSIWKSKT